MLSGIIHLSDEDLEEVLAIIKNYINTHNSFDALFLDQYIDEFGKDNLSKVTFFVFAIGFFLYTIETYWQPQFTSLLPNNSLLWLLGILAFLYFTAAILGNLISEKAIATTNNHYKKVYFISRLLLIGSLFSLSLKN